MKPRAYTDFKILPNGNLLLTAANEARHDLAGTLRSGEWCRAWYDLIGPFQENGQLHTVEPEWIAALTDAPILTDDLTIEDDGTPNVLGKVWWFPSYMIRDPLAELASRGRVEFTAA